MRGIPQISRRLSLMINNEDTILENEDIDNEIYNSSGSESTSDSGVCDSSDGSVDIGEQEDPERRESGEGESDGLVFTSDNTSDIDYTELLLVINDNICVLNDNFSISIVLSLIIVILLLFTTISKFFKGFGL